MQKLTIKNKLMTVAAVSLLTISLGCSLPASAGIVTFADHAPAGPSYPCCLEDLGGTPTGADGGISYEWMVKMGRTDKATLINSVGAKSLSELPPFYVSPDVGWTHTANWIA